MDNFWDAAKNLNSPLSLKSRDCFEIETSFTSKWRARRPADCPVKSPWKSGLQPDESITRQQFADLSSGKNDPLRQTAAVIGNVGRFSRGILGTPSTVPFG